MLIKVCGMREPENIRDVEQLGIDLIGFIFWKPSPRYVSSIPVLAGTMPDASSLTELDGQRETTVLDGSGKRPERVGVFVDEMPQNVVANAYNYNLDYLQFHGNESVVYIDNVRRTIVPDILPNVKIIKALSIKEADDVKRWREYEGHVDLFLFDTKCKCVGGSGEQFDWSVLDAYDGETPFILSGGIGPGDAVRVKSFSHPKCIGIDLNSRFEISPALKDTDKLRGFLAQLEK